jgi:hypothetical protein
MLRERKILSPSSGTPKSNIQHPPRPTHFLLPVPIELDGGKVKILFTFFYFSREKSPHDKTILAKGCLRRRA